MTRPTSCRPGHGSSSSSLQHGGLAELCITSPLPSPLPSHLLFTPFMIILLVIGNLTLQIADGDVAKVSPRDRWGGTPLGDSERGLYQNPDSTNFQDCVRILKEATHPFLANGLCLVRLCSHTLFAYPPVALCAVHIVPLVTCSAHMPC